MKFNYEHSLRINLNVACLDGDLKDNIEYRMRSSTLKSNFTEYDTPPETPEFNIDSGSSSLNSTLSRTSNKEVTNGAGSLLCPAGSSDHLVSQIP